MHHTCQRFGEEESWEFHEAISWSGATAERLPLRNCEGRMGSSPSLEAEGGKLTRAEKFINAVRA